MRAILSVSDKTGLVDFAKGLHDLGIEMFSTGGTKKALEDAGVPVRSVSDLTGFPEIMDGRVKTLHPAIHGGILARRDVPAHLEQLAQHGIGTIDLVVVNLYPFVQTVSKQGVSLEEALENIDIGGPTMIRASAKNFPDVVIVVDPGDYTSVLGELKSGSVSQESRKELAKKAFQHTASYDTAIAQYLRPAEEIFPPDMTLGMRKIADLRYGENPHQKAAFYEEQKIGQSYPATITAANQVWGPELSFNNILDLDAALSAVKEFAEPTISIIKHTNPCGLASYSDLTEAYRRAFVGDPVSAYGGIVGSNRRIDLATAEAMRPTHYDCMIAPSYEDAALEILKKKGNIRILATGGDAVPVPRIEELGLDVRRVSGGFLLQTPDLVVEDQVKLKVVTDRAPTKEEAQDLLFAWKAVKLIKSNAIVLVKDRALLGMGAGQPNRVTSVQISVERAGDRSQGSVLGSDAFFPFPDGVEAAAKAGVTAIIQPGGSIRDEDAIRVANQYKIAMVFTGERHFRH